MEEDRAEVDLGIAADIEAHEYETVAQQKQPKKRFVGRRQAAEVAAKNAVSTENGETSSALQSRYLHPFSTQAALLTLYGRSTTPKSTSPPQSCSSRDLRRSRDQRSNCSPALKLLLRNPQDDSSHPHKWLQESCAANAGRTSHVCNHDFRHLDTILPRHWDFDHGRCDVWCLLYWRLHCKSTWVRFVGTLCSFLFDRCGCHQDQDVVCVCRHQYWYNTSSCNITEEFPLGKDDCHGRDYSIQRHTSWRQKCIGESRIQHPHSTNRTTQ